MQILGILPFRGQFHLTMWFLSGASIVLLDYQQACSQSSFSHISFQASDSSSQIAHVHPGNPSLQFGFAPDSTFNYDLLRVRFAQAGFLSGLSGSKTLRLKQQSSVSPPDAPFYQEVFKINPLKVAGVSAVGLVGLFYLERYQEQAWWRGHTTQFRFVNDGSFAGNFDKLGHTFGAYIQSSAVSNAMEWSGFDPQTAAYIGFAAALLQQTYIEVNDGVTKFWGFSPGDMFSNIIGSTYPLAQTTFPELKHFTPKFSYHTSTQYKKVHWAQSYIDDYEGLTFWMSVDVHHYLPSSIKPYWPSFLNLALGTGLRNYVEEESWQHTVFISFDINMQKLPGNGPILSALKTVLNYVHLPLPAVMIYPKVVGIALKF